MIITILRCGGPVQQEYNSHTVVFSRKHYNISILTPNIAYCIFPIEHSPGIFTQSPFSRHIQIDIPEFFSRSPSQELISILTSTTTTSTMRRALRILGGTVLLLPCFLLVSATSSDEDGKKGKSDEKEEKHLPRWGETGYWVALKNLQVTGASFKPSFKPFFEGPYEVVIDSAETPKVHLMPELNLHQYPPRYPPDLHFNGEKLAYSPVAPISVPIVVNKTMGPLDEEITLEISDPQGGLTGPSMTYTLRLRQGPHPDVTRMTSLTV